MIKIDIDKARSLIKDKQEVNLAQIVVDRLNTVELDRSKRLSQELNKFKDIDLMESKNYYYEKDEVRDNIININNRAIESSENYFRTLSKLISIIFGPTRGL